MTGPYLHSGESIILTTDRISLDSVLYDAMLTTERFILIDSRYARFEPVSIPLLGIQSVKSGMAATGEPVIVLTATAPDVPEPRIYNILFSQQPLENRKPDRDLWLKKFIGLAVSDREVRGPETPQPPDQKSVLQPSVRRWVAPEVIRPRSEITRPKIETPTVLIRIEEPEGVSTTKKVPEDTGTEEQTLPVTVRNEDDAGVYEEEIPIVRAERESEPTESLQHSIQAALESLKEKNEKEREIRESGPVLETPVRLTSPLPELTGSPQPEDVSEEAVVVPALEVMVLPVVVVPEDEKPEPAVRTASPVPDPFPEPGKAEIPEAQVQGEQEQGITQEILVPPAGDVAGLGVVPDTRPELPLFDEIPEVFPDKTVESPAAGMPERSPEALFAPPLSPVPPEPAKIGTGSLALIGGVIVCILLILAGLVVLSVLPTGGPHTPTVITSPTPTGLPEITPSPSPALIPQEGVWVRIVSPGNYRGEAGNAGSLQDISGSGEKLYKVRDSGYPVRVVVEKLDNTGNELLVGIYKNGRLISSRSVTAPMGSIDLLVDPVTEQPPGLVTAGHTPDATAAASGTVLYY